MRPLPACGRRGSREAAWGMSNLSPCSSNAFSSISSTVPTSSTKAVRPSANPSRRPCASPLWTAAKAHVVGLVARLRLPPGHRSNSAPNSALVFVPFSGILARSARPPWLISRAAVLRPLRRPKRAQIRLAPSRRPMRRPAEPSRVGLDYGGPFGPLFARCARCGLDFAPHAASSSPQPSLSPRSTPDTSSSPDHASITHRRPAPVVNPSRRRSLKLVELLSRSLRTCFAPSPHHLTPAPPAGRRSNHACRAASIDPRDGRRSSCSPPAPSPAPFPPSGALEGHTIRQRRAAHRAPRRRPCRPPAHRSTLSCTARPLLCQCHRVGRRGLASRSRPASRPLTAPRRRARRGATSEPRDLITSSRRLRNP